MSASQKTCVYWNIVLFTFNAKTKAKYAYIFCALIQQFLASYRICVKRSNNFDKRPPWRRKILDHNQTRTAAPCIIQSSTVVLLGSIMTTCILTTLGSNGNGITAIHLMKSYCIPPLLKWCEIRSLQSLNYHKMNVIWNNSFRKIIQCCWRKRLSCSFYYCKTLLLSYITNQSKILFYEKDPNLWKQCSTGSLHFKWE